MLYATADEIEDMQAKRLRRERAESKGEIADDGTVCGAPEKKSVRLSIIGADEAKPHAVEAVHRMRSSSSFSSIPDAAASCEIRTKIL
jgi:hypothetical protein